MEFLTFCVAVKRMIVGEGTWNETLCVLCTFSSISWAVNSKFRWIKKCF